MYYIRKQSVLHMKTTKQQLKIIDKVCKAFSFNGINDRKTIITRKEAALAGRIIKPLQNDILKSIKYDYTLKLKQVQHENTFDAKTSLTILRGLMRSIGRRLASTRTYKYCKTKKGPVTIYSYNLL